VIFDALVFGHLRRNGLRTILTLFALAGSVAIVVVLGVTDSTIGASLASASETLADRANLSLVAAPGGFDEALLARVRQSDGVSETRPQTRDTIALRNERGEERLDVRGVDLANALPYDIDPRTTVPGPFVRDGGAPAFSALVGANAIFVSRRVARAFALETGSALRDANDPRVAFRVAGVLRTVAGAIDSNVAFIDIATAQRVFAKRGRLDRIDAMVAPAALAALHDRLRASLPPGIVVSEPAAVARENASFASGIRDDFDVFAALALLLGAAAVANALAISVEVRRADIGMLRTIGATSGQIFATFLSEGAMLGGLGSLLGLGIGAALAQALIPHLLTRIDGVSFEFAPLLRAFAYGVCAAVIAALVPARNAARTLPAAAMRGRGFEPSFGKPARTLARIAACCLVAAFALRSRAGTIVSAIAATSIVPFALVTLGTIPRRTRAISNVSIALALRDLAATARRTSVAVIALALALALTTAVAVFADSFATTLLARVERALPGDFRLTADTDRTPAAKRRTARLVMRIGTYAAVAKVTTAADTIVVTAGPDADRTSLRRLLEREPLARGRPLENTGELRAAFIGRSQATQGAAYALVLATFVIALLGVATTFAALVLERRGEIAMLRYIGMTSRGVRDMVLYTAGVVGALACALGIALGLAIGTRLVAATDAHALGTDLTVHVPYGTLAAIATLTLFGAVAAGAYPARLASRMRAAGVATP